jgi:uncharacterized membrane protein YgcG
MDISAALAAGHLSRYFGRLDSWREQNNINLEQCQAAKRQALVQFYATNPDETVTNSEHLSASQQFTNKRLMQEGNETGDSARPNNLLTSQERAPSMVCYALDYVDIQTLLNTTLVSRQLRKRVKENHNWAMLKSRQLEHSHDHDIRTFASNHRLLFSGDTFGVIKVWNIQEDFRYMRDMHCRDTCGSTATPNSESTSDSATSPVVELTEGNSNANYAKLGSNTKAGSSLTKPGGSKTGSSKTGQFSGGSTTDNSSKLFNSRGGSSKEGGSSSFNEDSSGSDAVQKVVYSDGMEAEASDSSSEDGPSKKKGKAPAATALEVESVGSKEVRQFQNLLSSYNKEDWGSVKAHRSEITGRIHAVVSHTVLVLMLLFVRRAGCDAADVIQLFF